mmetsp:Transcript_40433/g.94996  ORF Transcript_40433/g.94996 Transcript_40433/m.94996 type:complete len:216 (-) Transcript_40433:334-981(-)
MYRGYRRGQRGSICGIYCCGAGHGRNRSMSIDLCQIFGKLTAQLPSMDEICGARGQCGRNRALPCAVRTGRLPTHPRHARARLEILHRLRTIGGRRQPRPRSIFPPPRAHGPRPRLDILGPVRRRFRRRRGRRRTQNFSEILRVSALCGRGEKGGSRAASGCVEGVGKNARHAVDRVRGGRYDAPQGAEEEEEDGRGWIFGGIGLGRVFRLSLSR